MFQHTPQPQNTFVVRFWWEWSGQKNPPSEASTMHGSGRWRGRIEHVQSGEGIAFQDARQMLAFVQRFISSLE